MGKGWQQPGSATVTIFRACYSQNWSIHRWNLYKQNNLARLFRTYLSLKKKRGTTSTKRVTLPRLGLANPNIGHRKTLKSFLVSIFILTLDHTVYESMLMVNHFRLHVPISACEPVEVSLRPAAGCRISQKKLQVSPVRSSRGPPRFSISSACPRWLYPPRQLPSLHFQRPIAGARIQWILYSVAVLSNNGETCWFCRCFHSWGRYKVRELSETS